MTGIRSRTESAR